MRRVTRRERRPQKLSVLLIVLALSFLSACGDNEVDVDDSLRSSGTDQFEIVSQDDGKYVVGHGIALEMGEGWTDYAEERDSTDGTTYEWAVGLPEDTLPVPAGLQFSMGKKGKGAPFKTLPDVTRELAELTPGYEMIDEGEADIPGAEDAAFLRFVQDFELNGQTQRLEQVQLMIKMPGGQNSVIRFIAAEGEWDQELEQVYDSLVVTDSASA